MNIHTFEGFSMLISIPLLVFQLYISHKTLAVSDKKIYTVKKYILRHVKNNGNFFFHKKKNYQTSKALLEKAQQDSEANTETTIKGPITSVSGKKTEIK